MGTETKVVRTVFSRLMVPIMGLKPFFTYFGGKWRLAPRYPRPIHKTIVEPFAGSAGYSLRFPHRQIILYDRDEFVVGVWKYLIGVSESEILSLPTDFEAVEDLKVCQEAKWFLGFWVGKGRSSPGLTMKRMWTARDNARNKDGCNTWGIEVQQKVAYQLQFIRHWRVIQESYKRVDISVPATWFVDPPYREQGHAYRCSSRNIDYEHLGKWCKFLPGQVIVCEGNEADWLPFSGFVRANGAYKNTVKELMWYREKNEKAPAKTGAEDESS